MNLSFFRKSSVQHVLTLIFFVGASIYYLHPLTLVWTDHIRELGDNLLVEYILSWTSYALTTPGVAIADINMFWPTKQVMLYVNSPFGLLPFFALFRAFSENGIMAYNMHMLFTYVMSGLGMYFLTRRWTGNFWAALIAGTVFAYFPFKHQLHLLTQSIYWLPFAVLALDVFLKRKKFSWLLYIGTVGVISLICLSSWYIAYMSAFGLAAYCLMFGRSWQDWKRIILVVIGIVAVITPFLIPYVSGSQFHPYDLASVDSFSVPIDEFVRLHSIFFLGFIPWALLLISVLSWREKYAKYLFVAFIVGTFMTLGPSLHIGEGEAGIPLPYRLLYEFMPFTDALRAVTRNYLLMMFAVAGLSAYGWVVLEKHVVSKISSVAIRSAVTSILAVAIIVVLVLESFIAPWQLYARGSIKRVLDRDHYQEVVIDGEKIYEALADLPREEPVLELPLYRYKLWRNMRYLHASTKHWHPLVNGYASFVPPEFGAFFDATCTIGTPESLTFLHESGVRYLIFHKALYDKPEEAGTFCSAGESQQVLDELNQNTENVRFIMQDEDAYLYEIHS